MLPELHVHLRSIKLLWLIFPGVSLYCMHMPPIGMQIIILNFPLECSYMNIANYSNVNLVQYIATCSYGSYTTVLAYYTVAI